MEDAEYRPLPKINIPIHACLTSEGMIIDQTPVSFWEKMRVVFQHTGFGISGVVPGKVYDVLETFSVFSKTWKFKAFRSYLYLREFNKVNMLAGEELQGQYNCYLDVLYEGEENELGNQAFTILRVNIVIVVLPRESLSGKFLIKLDMLNPVQIVKSPQDFLIEKNFP